VTCEQHDRSPVSESGAVRSRAARERIDPLRPDSLLCSTPFPGARAAARLSAHAPHTSDNARAVGLLQAQRSGRSHGVDSAITPARLPQRRRRPDRLGGGRLRRPGRRDRDLCRTGGQRNRTRDPRLAPGHRPVRRGSRHPRHHDQDSRGDLYRRRQDQELGHGRRPDPDHPAGNGPVLLTYASKPQPCTNSQPAADRTFTIAVARTTGRSRG
jgi:hypothetical protein